ncbi:MAG: VTT domain-containing protein [Opitutaceae bacterium]
MPSVQPAAKKIPWVKLAVAAVVLLVVAAVVWRGLNVRAYLDRGMDLIRAASPSTFFICMALLPAVGVPVLAFVLTAGPLWGEKMGMGTVMLLSLSALTVNFVMTYFLARYAFRPLLTKLIVRLGYKLPKAEAGDATSFIVIMRVTQGIPYCVQNYLLGLAEVPFGKYFLLTVLLSLPQNAAAIYFGDAIMRGRGGMIAMVGGLLVALVALTHVVRRHFAQKKKAA